MQDLLVSGKGSIRDKLRLLGVYCLAVRPSTAEVTELEGLLKQSAASSGVDGAEQEAERGLGAIGYLRKQVGDALPMVKYSASIFFGDVLVALRSTRG